MSLLPTRIDPIITFILIFPSLFLQVRGSGWIQTLHLRISGRMPYRCATAAGHHFIKPLMHHLNHQIWSIGQLYATIFDLNNLF